MNRHALSVLEYAAALDIVAGHASGPLGAEAVRSLEPSDAVAWVEPELRRVDQMVAFLLASVDWSVPPVPDLRTALRRLAVEGSILEAHVLRDIGVLLVSARATRRTLLPRGDDYPLLRDIALLLVKLEAETAAITRAIDESGAVRDQASRELSKLRQEIRGARSRIVQALERFAASLPERIRVADASVSVRDGRYVIPVRREGRSEVGGLVHDESATGGTLFVEPPVAIDLMNRLRELELAEAREVQRILRELTDLLRPHLEPLQETLHALITLDSLYARARYALHCNGRRPHVLPPGSEEYDVVHGFHPLLLAGPDPVVPFDLRFDPGERTLLVSGPNTGGKTVLLKAIGLISALVQSGIIPPIGDGSRLPIFRNIFADIGDEQSIEASLSTFSAHLKNLQEILELADDRSLVLIDEIGSGTDPAEGGALARSILIELTKRAALTVATSHLGELKLLAGGEPAVVNASLQFDSGELRPTYRLVKGVPGRSYGLAIARRLGMPAAVLERAEKLLPQAERDASQLLLELEEKERRMAEALEELEASRREAARLRQELDEREHVVRKREREAEQRARQQARDLLLHARAEVESAIRELREQVDVGAEGFDELAREARRRVEEAAKRQGERAAVAGEASPARATRDETAAPPSELEPGTPVRVLSTGAAGRVIEVRDGRATIETGGIRLQVPAHGLAVVKPEEVERAVPVRSHGGWSGPEAEARSEVHLRGLRAEEVAGTLEPALDAAVRADLASLRIVHGKGTGALREVVAEILRADSRVKSFRPGGPGEGGSGVTVAELT